MERMPELFGPEVVLHVVTPPVPLIGQLTTPEGATAPATPETVAV